MGRNEVFDKPAGFGCKVFPDFPGLVGRIVISNNVQRLPLGVAFIQLLQECDIVSCLVLSDGLLFATGESELGEESRKLLDRKSVV